MLYPIELWVPKSYLQRQPEPTTGSPSTVQSSVPSSAVELSCGLEQIRREPEPFFRTQTGTWYVQIGKKQHDLGRTSRPPSKVSRPDGRASTRYGRHGRLRGSVPVCGLEQGARKCCDCPSRGGEHLALDPAKCEGSDGCRQRLSPPCRIWPITTPFGTSACRRSCSAA
jgi:hypothetical protein